MSTTLHRLEDPRTPYVGGVLVTFPSGSQKSLSWKSREPISDPLAMGKDLAARALASCLDERRIDDAERTNWASVAAAATRIVRDWNADVGAQGARAVGLADPGSLP